MYNIIIVHVQYGLCHKLRSWPYLLVVICHRLAVTVLCMWHFNYGYMCYI